MLHDSKVAISSQFGFNMLCLIARMNINSKDMIHAMCLWISGCQFQTETFCSIFSLISTGLDTAIWKSIQLENDK